MSQNPTLYWHDYETFGTDPRRDWPSQFAGVRTDMDFNIIGKPLMIFCKPAQDCLPHPEACLLTKISPLKALESGLIEREFIAKILNEMAQANTCSLGYNNLRFDDEVTRNALYRNFYDPYQREYQNGNSRWDLIDLVRMTHALRPEGIHWPQNEQGHPSFKLELLTKANGIGHDMAHDALADVFATIEFAKLLKNKQTKLFEYLFELRKKEKASELIQRAYHEPVVHVSSKFPASENCLAMVLAICPEPGNKNATVVYDLSKDLDILLEASPQQIRELLYTKTEELPEAQQRPPIKSVHSNKCPALAPQSVLRDEDKERLKLNLNTIEKNLELFKKHQTTLAKKVTEVFQESSFPEYSDPDLCIYSGGFFSWKDKNTMQQLINMNAQQLNEAQNNLNFEDARLSEMLFRYRARNFPDSLSTEEKIIWKQFCQEKLSGNSETSSISFENYDKKVKQLIEESAGNLPALALLDELKQYANLLRG